MHTATPRLTGVRGHAISTPYGSLWGGYMAMRVTHPSLKKSPPRFVKTLTKLATEPFVTTPLGEIGSGPGRAFCVLPEDRALSGPQCLAECGHSFAGSGGERGGHSQPELRIIRIVTPPEMGGNKRRQVSCNLVRGSGCSGWQSLSRSACSIIVTLSHLLDEGNVQRQVRSNAGRCWREGLPELRRPPAEGDQCIALFGMRNLYLWTGW